MDKLRSTLKQFIRDWSEDVRVSMTRRLSAVRHQGKACGIGASLQGRLVFCDWLLF